MYKRQQKLLGKARFDELLTAYIEKPQGKPTLVPDSDKRPAMNTAKNDFMEENDNAVSYTHLDVYKRQEYGYKSS